MKSMDDSLIDSLSSSRYEKICQRMARTLSEDDVKSLKFVLRNRIDKSHLDKVADARDMVQVMEHQNILSEEMLPHVHTLLKDAGIDHTRIFRGSSRTESDSTALFEGISKQDDFDIRSMNVVGNFKETERLQRMVEIVETKRAVLVKGPNGSGKSQSAFWYARQFQRKNPSSVVWRVCCKSERSVYLSFATLMSHLKLECILSDYDTEDCIRTMLELAISNLTNKRNVTRKHLIVLDDIESPEDFIVHNAMDKFIIAENIYVIATSNKRFLPDDYDKYGMEMDKMTETEAISLFSFSSEVEEKEVKLLAKNLDYLPLALSLAASYIKITHISVKGYNENLLGSQLQADTLGAQSLARSYSMTLNRLDNEISNAARRVISYVSYLNHQNISVTLLKSFLPNRLSRTERENEINKLLLALTDYSLAVVEGVGENRIISIHGVSSLMIENSKTERQIKKDVKFLLQHYCYNLDTDARLVESMKRNICFIHHAVLLLRKYSHHFEVDSFERKVYESYLCCAIGGTFRLYGSTELSADDYFVRAKQIIFDEISLPVPERALHTGVVSKLEDYLYGNLLEQEEARQVYLKLLEKSSGHLSINFIENFLTNKYRSSREIQIFTHYGKINPKEIPNNKLPLHITKEMVLKELVVPFEHTRETFVVDLLITIMSNSSKNKWWMEASKVNSYAHRDVRPHHHDGSHQLDSLTEFRFSHNLAQYLNIYYREHYPQCNPIASTVTKRNGILYFLRSNDKIESDELKELIITLDEMFNKSANTYYTSFGSLKMAPKFNLHHRCLITRMLVKCYIKLWENDKDSNDLSEALFQAEKLAGLAREMSEWLTLTSVYSEIAQTYLLDPSPQNIRTAKQNYKLAYEKAQEGGTILNTEYHLKLYLQYISFCLKYGNSDDLVEAEQICLEMHERCVQSETKETVQSQLLRIQQKINKPKVDRVKMFLCLVMLFILALAVWIGVQQKEDNEL